VTGKHSKGSGANSIAFAIAALPKVDISYIRVDVCSSCKEFFLLEMFSSPLD